MIEITDDDIRRAEKIFLKEGHTFKDEKNERYDFIKCIDRSLDLEACPGSGKTTSLLAKLYLLSEKLGDNDGRGICVLTHTNVAIDEIKSVLGKKADRFFRYPNFFGTIQSFVDRFLAFPYYAMRLNKRPAAVDPVLAGNRLRTTYLKTPQNENSTDYAEKIRKVKYFLAVNNLHNEVSYYLDENGQQQLVSSSNLKPITISKPNRDKSADIYNHDELIKILWALKLHVVRTSGLLTYNDAYFFAYRYIQKHPQITKAISSRFSHLFIDEMQDTNEMQGDLFKKIFDGQTIIQRIGDLNQAIMNDNNSFNSWELSSALQMKISGSHRVSQPIAKVLRTVALKGDDSLVGYNDERIPPENRTIPPYIISYKKGEEQKVLDKYIKIIKDHRLEQPINKYPLMALGWRGTRKQNRTSIHTYFPDFNKTSSKKIKADTFDKYITSQTYKSAKELYDDLLQICVQYYSSSNGANKRYFNRGQFVKMMEKDYPEVLYEYRLKVVEWFKKISQDESIDVLEIRDYITNVIFNKLEVKLYKNGKKYFGLNEVKKKKTASKVLANNRIILNENIYYSQKEDLKNIPIGIAKVHAEKGKTHRATLYMETSYHKLTGEYFIKQLTGTRHNEGKRKLKDQSLKVAHVAMSRPTHLLCVALNSELVNENYAKLCAAGWEIEEASSN